MGFRKRGCCVRNRRESQRVCDGDSSGFRVPRDAVLRVLRIPSPFLSVSGVVFTSVLSCLVE
ncbi:hypothetical protein BRCON_2190 [Candidatus Sumerlaea chitinivorans]|uniref:Uncharacterized protein n=1 Tax=Sumerlaea chitinivorans TaxID=2250252 RepID=A0A2Z4Y6V5_SUMC1|nr:hypothetical protein BRCON_2190 [Candidatus Sumerlaea chitinivorans]